METLDLRCGFGEGRFNSKRLCHPDGDLKVMDQFLSVLRNKNCSLKALHLNSTMMSASAVWSIVQFLGEKACVLREFKFLVTDKYQNDLQPVFEQALKSEFFSIEACFIDHNLDVVHLPSSCQYLQVEFFLNLIAELPLKSVKTFCVGLDIFNVAKPWLCSLPLLATYRRKINGYHSICLFHPEWRYGSMFYDEERKRLISLYRVMNSLLLVSSRGLTTVRLTIDSVQRIFSSFLGVEKQGGISERWLSIMYDEFGRFQSLPGHARSVFFDRRDKAFAVPKKTVKPKDMSVS